MSASSDMTSLAKQACSGPPNCLQNAFGMEAAGPLLARLFRRACDVPRADSGDGLAFLGAIHVVAILKQLGFFGRTKKTQIVFKICQVSKLFVNRNDGRMLCHGRTPNPTQTLTWYVAHSQLQALPALHVGPVCRLLLRHCSTLDGVQSS